VTKAPRLTTLRPRVSIVANRLAPGPKVAAPVYSSPEWRTLIAAIIKRRLRRCEKCGITGTKIYGDHRLELADGGAPLDEANIQLLCAACHGRKTVDERNKRMAKRW
jgi:5-methylcytosine-specific restriction enzyme A